MKKLNVLIAVAALLCLVGCASVPEGYAKQNVAIEVGLYAAPIGSSNGFTNYAPIEDVVMNDSAIVNNIKKNLEYFDVKNKTSFDKVCFYHIIMESVKTSGSDGKVVSDSISYCDYGSFAYAYHGDEYISDAKELKKIKDLIATCKTQKKTTYNTTYASATLGAAQNK